MRPDSPKYLEDIRDAAAFVLETTRDSDLARYLENRLLRQDLPDLLLTVESLLKEAEGA